MLESIFQSSISTLNLLHMSKLMVFDNHFILDDIIGLSHCWYKVRLQDSD